MMNDSIGVFFDRRTIPVHICIATAPDTAPAARQSAATIYHRITSSIRKDPA